MGKRGPRQSDPVSEDLLRDVFKALEMLVFLTVLHACVCSYLPDHSEHQDGHVVMTSSPRGPDVSCGRRATATNSLATLPAAARPCRYIPEL